MEKINIWKEPFRVRSYYMDMKARATITSIAGFLQEVSGNHADYMGFGYRQMQESGLLWLLTRVKIVVHQYPHWADELEVTTWVVDAAKYFSRRDFEIHDKTGKLLVSAISGWMLVNAREKRPQLVESLSRNIDLLKDKMALNEDIQKIEALTSADTSSYYTVKYSDIDIVNHVNNIEYYNIILDSIPASFRKEFYIESFEINYIAEALLGDELEIVSQQITGNQDFIYEVRRNTDKKVLCRSLIKWKKDAFNKPII